MIRKSEHLFAAILYFLPIGSALAIDRLEHGFPELPRDARQVAERSVACRYFSSELNGDGGERDKEVTTQLRKLRCASVARELKSIRAKYRKQATLLSVLKEADQ